MSFKMTAILASFLLGGWLVPAVAADTSIPDAIAAPGEAIVFTLHAEGAQVYECKAGGDGKLAWSFREPIATLLLDNKTVRFCVAAAMPSLCILLGFWVVLVRPEDLSAWNRERDVTGRGEIAEAPGQACSENRRLTAVGNRAIPLRESAGPRRPPAKDAVATSSSSTRIAR